MEYQCLIINCAIYASKDTTVAITTQCPNLVRLESGCFYRCNDSSLHTSVQLFLDLILGLFGNADQYVYSYDRHAHHKSLQDEVDLPGGSAPWPELWVF